MDVSDALAVKKLAPVAVVFATNKAYACGTEEPMKWLLDNSAKWAGALSLALLALTTAHDWGYFTVVGPKLRSIQTPYDYVTNAIEWLPPLLGLFAFGAVAGLSAGWIFEWIRGPKPEEAAPLEHLIHRRAKVAALRSAGISLVGSILGIWLSLRQPAPTNLGSLAFYGVPIVGVWLLTATAYRHGPKVNPLIPVSVGVGMFLAFTFSWGVIDGLDAIRSTTAVHAITLRGGETRQVSMLRSFEKGLLILNPSAKRVEFVRWEQIEKVGHFVAVDGETSGCRMLNWFCKPVNDP